jgi:CheY-like chemotaxis protein
MAARRILITDDEALFRSSAAESLRARFHGTEVLEAEDGAAALALLERLPVDVLITDLAMPRLGGLDLVARISSHRMPIQIIVVSAHITDQTRLTLDDLGALVCVDKPIDLDVLHQAVERMLAVPRAHVSGVTLAGFVQLLEMEHQTCALRIVSPDGVGTLVFEHGRLVDAWTGELCGDPAALAILCFQDTTLDVIGALRTEVRRVTQPLSFLLLESARRADEREPEQVAGQWEIVSLDDAAPVTATTSREEAPGLGQDHRGGTRKASMSDIKTSMQNSLKIGGCLGAALVDYESGMCLGAAGNPGFDLELAAAGNTEVVRAKKTIRDKLGLKDKIEDILISLTGQYHLIRMVGTRTFIYAVFDRSKSNLALARKELEAIEKAMDIDRS